MLAVAFALFATACDGQVTDATSEPTTLAAPTSTARTTTTTEAPPDIFEPGPLGAVDIAPGEPIVIADIRELDRPLGQEQAVEVDIKIEEIGGEWLGHPIQLTHHNYPTCFLEADRTATQEVVSNPKLVGIIGTSCWPADIAISRMMSPLGLVQISGPFPDLLTSSMVDEDWSPGYFRISHNDEHQGKAAATYAYNELGSRTAGVMHSGGPYSGGLAGGFQVAFEALGGTVAEFTAVEKEATDVRPVLEMFEAKGVDLIFFPVLVTNATALVTQVGEFPGLAGTVLFSADAVLSASFIEDVAESRSVYVSAPAIPNRDRYLEFTKRHEEILPYPPDARSQAHAYDAISLLLDAIESVAVIDDDGTLHVDRQALRDQLYSTTDYPGLTGLLTCDQDGDCVSTGIKVMRNTDNTMRGLMENVLRTYP